MWNLSPEYRFPMVAFPWFPIGKLLQSSKARQKTSAWRRLSKRFSMSRLAATTCARTSVRIWRTLGLGYRRDTLPTPYAIYIYCVCACICMCICMYTIIYICRSLFSIISTVIIIYVYNVHIYIYIHILCTQCGTCLYCTNIF